MMFVGLFLQIVLAKCQLARNKHWIINCQTVILTETYYDSRIESSTNLSLYNSTFNSIRNKLLSGGAIYIKFDRKYDIVYNNFINCTFNNCLSKNGGAICIEGDPDVTKKYNIKIKIESNTFKANVAINNGGAVYIDVGDVTFSESNFINNQIDGENIDSLDSLFLRGGAICTSTISKYENCYFINNSILMKKLTVNNGIDAYGGAIYCGLDYNPQNNEIFNCIFENNSICSIDSISVDYTDSYYGGAIYYRKDFSIDKCSFKNNFIYIISQAKLKSLSGGSAIYNHAYDMNISNCDFIKNSIFSDISEGLCDQEGGSINFFYCTSVVKNCAFIDNYLDGLKTARFIEGGAFYGYKSKITFFECNITNNTAFKDNSPAIRAAGISFSDSDCNFKKCFFYNNSRYNGRSSNTNQGGAIYSDEGNLSCYECSFIDNYAYFGADIYFIFYDFCSLIISDCLFERKIIENGEKEKSLIELSINNIENNKFIFTNNIILIKNNSMLLYVFGNRNKLKCSMIDNCIWPFDSKYYDANKCNLYDENGINQITFEKVFTSKCMQSIVFTPSNDFTKSFIYTPSDDFTKSLVYTPSNCFTLFLASTAFSPNGSKSIAFST